MLKNIKTFHGKKSLSVFKGAPFKPFEQTKKEMYDRKIFKRHITEKFCPMLVETPYSGRGH